MPGQQTYSEEQLISKLQQQDQSAFSYLYDNYAAALNGVIHRMIDDTQLAEDILQEAFLKIWNNFKQYDQSKGRLFTWMVNITRNLTIDTLRSKGYKKQQKILHDEKSVGGIKDSNLNADRFDTMGLRKQVSGLKPEHKIIIDLAYFGGYTQEEIAKELSIPLGTVKTRMRAAIIELRKLLRDQK
ncbi:MAG: sigma-70 family RNA polymerase sigma factor [Chitinophagaceae bacterium]|nr:MAG: sigma-70 family RNA polymerase sigma factor [Chitinophagaceae bacterium]